MARTAVIDRSGRERTGPVNFDKLRFWLFAAHVAIIFYVAVGWLLTSRSLLYFYTLLLPMMVIQCLLNGGCSIVNNIENLLRIGRWRDPENVFERSCFQNVHRAVGLRPSHGQLPT